MSERSKQFLRLRAALRAQQIPGVVHLSIAHGKHKHLVGLAAFSRLGAGIVILFDEIFYRRFSLFARMRFQNAREDEAWRTQKLLIQAPEMKLAFSGSGGAVL